MLFQGTDSGFGGKLLQGPVLIYTHPDCGSSTSARDDLIRNGVQYREIDLGVNPDAWKDVEELTGGQRRTPVIVDGNNVTIGFNGIA